MKSKSSQNGAKGVRIGLSKVGAVVLVMLLVSANAGVGVARGPAAEDRRTRSGGGSVKGMGMMAGASMEMEASGSTQYIYVVGGSQIMRLSPIHGGTKWSVQDRASEEVEVRSDGVVFAANGTNATSYSASGGFRWRTHFDFSISELGEFEYHKNEVTVWDHNEGFENKAYSIDEDNGSKINKIATKFQKTRQIEGWGDYYYGESQDTVDSHRQFIKWDAPLTGSNSNAEEINRDFWGNAMGSNTENIWIETASGGNIGSKFRGFDSGAQREYNTTIGVNESQIAGYADSMYGVAYGSVRKYDVQSDGNWTMKWNTSIWGSNDPMHVKVDEGTGDVLVANNYDVALLDKDGNVIWNRTFSFPVEDIAISNSEPETYTLSGEVFDANNNPIENATIELQTQFQTIAGAQTNASGYYEITGISPGTYEVVAWKSGYNTVKKQRDISSDIVLDFLLQKSDESTLEGTVDDSVGNPIENATVEVVSNGQTISSAKTDSNGFYSVPGIPNGTYEVVASKQGYQSTSVTLTINSYTTQDFILVKGENIVRGYVRDTDGDVIEDVIVAFGQGGSAVTSTTTDKDGYYEVLIDDGNYTVIFSKNGYEEVKLNRSIFSNQWLNVTMGNLTLIIEAPRYMEHGTAAEYKVWVSNGTDRWEVTGHSNLTLSSSNYSVVGIDRANQELEATSDTSVNKLVIIRANYEYTNQTELYDAHEVTVANSTVSQLPILPPWWRVNAVMNDDTIFALILMIWTAVVGSRWTTAFGGLGFGTIAGIILWYAGYLSVGMMLLSVFVAIFLGMNVAANIDYSVIK